MKQIAIFQSDLNVGGIQKAIINLLENIDENEYDIDLFIFDENEFFNNEFKSNVHIKKLKRANIILKYLPYSISSKLYTPPIDLNKKYDVAIDFNSFWHECAIGAQKVNAKKRVMWLHSDIQKKIEVEVRYKIAWALGKSKFKHFDELIAVSQGVKDSFYPVAKKSDKNMKIRVVGNVVDTDEIFKKAQEKIDFTIDENKYNFVSVGRLGYEKGYDILINYFSEVVKARQDVHLYLIGEGDQRENLLKQISQLNLDNYVTLLGNKSNPFPYVNKMDGFVLTSRYEGQGIVLWEAKALGLPIFMTKNLEKYNPGILGCDDMVKSMITANKKEKTYDNLNDYNNNIKNEINDIFSN